jgi:large subunit ribosomal protein L15e
MYHHIGKAWEKPHASYVDEVQWGRMIQWRREAAIVRVEHPTRLDRARQLGYKAKQGIVIARIRVRRGGLRKRAIRGGRRPRRKGILRITMKKSIQRIGEERVATHYPNLEVLNSYWVGSDGKHQYFETILVDPHHPAILADPQLSWIADPANRGRAFRGLTSAGKKGRGLRWQGKGSEKARPSRRARIRKKLARGRRTQELLIGRPQGHRK